MVAVTALIRMAFMIDVGLLYSKCILEGVGCGDGGHGGVGGGVGVGGDRLLVVVMT